MLDVLVPSICWIKAFHIIAVIAWMAGMLYLPRLFVYHCEVAAGSAESETLQGDGAAASSDDHQPGDDRGLGARPDARARRRRRWMPIRAGSWRKCRSGLAMTRGCTGFFSQWRKRFRARIATATAALLPDLERSAGGADDRDRHSGRGQTFLKKAATRA